MLRRRRVGLRRATRRRRRGFAASVFLRRRRLGAAEAVVFRRRVTFLRRGAAVLRTVVFRRRRRRVGDAAAFLRFAARAFLRFLKLAARAFADVALRLMPVLLLVTELLRLRAELDLSFVLLRRSRVRAARASRRRALPVIRLVLRGVLRRLYAPRPLMEAMCVTPGFRFSDRRRVRRRGGLTY